MIKKIGKLIALIFLLAAMTIGCLAGLGYMDYKEAIDQTSIEDKMESIQSHEDYVTLEQLPELYCKAVVAVEDHDFYEHQGIDIEAIGRAVLNNLKAMSFVEGGSTITQQLAKNEFFTQDKNFVRKFAEIFMAFDIESKYSKDQILELYVNSIYFGEGYYGIHAASLGYFQVEPADLNEAQCILLAGIPNAPSVYSLNVNPVLAKQRAKQVLRQMVKYSFLSEDEAQNIAYQLDQMIVG